MTALITLLTTALVAIGRTDLVWVLGTVGTDTLASLASALKSDTDNLAGGATAAAEWLAVGLTELLPAPLPLIPTAPLTTTCCTTALTSSQGVATRQRLKPWNVWHS